VQVDLQRNRRNRIWPGGAPRNGNADAPCHPAGGSTSGKIGPTCGLPSPPSGLLRPPDAIDAQGIGPNAGAGTGCADAALPRFRRAWNAADASHARNVRRGLSSRRPIRQKKIHGFDCTLIRSVAAGRLSDIWLLTTRLLSIPTDHAPITSGRHFGPPNAGRNLAGTFAEQIALPIEATLKMEPGDRNVFPLKWIRSRKSRFTTKNFSSRRKNIFELKRPQS